MGGCPSGMPALRINFFLSPSLCHSALLLLPTVRLKLLMINVKVQANQTQMCITLQHDGSNAARYSVVYR